MITDPLGAIRPDVASAWLTKETRSLNTPTPMCRWPELIVEDPQLDLALLRVDFKKNSAAHWLGNEDGFPHIEISVRMLEEGESVYSFGYPLSRGGLAADPPLEGAMMGYSVLHPRVTSAVVSSTLEASGPVTTSADPIRYVLDKALNYGNSGGPIVSADTGYVHAVCTRFQPLVIPQSHLTDSAGRPLEIMIPSLYGIVVGLNNQSFLGTLDDHGIAVSERT